MNNIIKLILSIIICEGAGIFGSIFTTKSVGGWYSTINKPSFNPPGWIFGPVWILLYLLMGISVFIIWSKFNDHNLFKSAIVIFSIQLLLNVFWSFLFFGQKSPLLAFIEIIFLWIAILITIIVFYKLNHLSSYLLIPYILWVSFAAFLNYSIWRLNL